MLTHQDLLVLPDLEDGFDNHKDYLHQRHNQNNYLRLAHELSSRRALAKERAEPEGAKLLHNQRSSAYTLNHKWIRSFLPIRPSSRGSNKAPGSCRGLYFISGQTNHAFSERMKFYRNTRLWLQLSTDAVFEVSSDARHQSSLVLPDLEYGFDNQNDYPHQRQNQNNNMSFTHQLSFRRAWTKGRVEPEAHNYF